jgi:hypothetical protein
MIVDTKELIGNTDAMAWAEAWCEIAEGIVQERVGVLSQDATELIDKGWMIGWFANAIMAGFDEGYDRQRRDIARMKYALNAGWNRAQYEYACEKELWEDDELAEILPTIRHEDEWRIGKVPVKVPLGDPTEYEFVHAQAFGGQLITIREQVATPEHLYADEDVARLAQQVEVLYDVIGDILSTTWPCEYNGEEFCHIHGVGRPCAFEIARSLINAK